MAFSAAETLELQTIRQKIIAGTATKADEMRGVELLRSGRIVAASASRASKAAKAPVDTSQALAGLMALKAAGNAGTLKV